MADRTDELISTTLDNYVSSTLENNIFNSIPLFYWMDKRGDGIKETQDGGNNIIVPLMYGKNSTAAAYSGYDLLDTTPQSGIGNATYDWKQYSVSVTIDRRSERKNSGSSQVVKLLKSKIMQAEMSLKDMFGEDVFAAQTGDKIVGLQNIVDPTPATGTVGGLNAATYSWWRNYQATGAKTTTIYDNLLSAMRLQYNTQSKGSAGDHPDLYMTDQTTYEGFESLLTTDINYNVGMVDAKLAEVGFEAYKFKGARVMWDNYCTSGYMYCLNSKYLKLYVDTKTDFISTPFIRPANQDARTAQILWMGELTTSNRSKHGILTTTQA